jgi:hypothetical protein
MDHRRDVALTTCSGGSCPVHVLDTSQRCSSKLHPSLQAFFRSIGPHVRERESPKSGEVSLQAVVLTALNNDQFLSSLTLLARQPLLTMILMKSYWNLLLTFVTSLSMKKPQKPNRRKWWGTGNILCREPRWWAAFKTMSMVTLSGQDYRTTHATVRREPRSPRCRSRG